MYVCIYIYIHTYIHTYIHIRKCRSLLLAKGLYVVLVWGVCFIILSLYELYVRLASGSLFLATNEIRAPQTPTRAPDMPVSKSVRSSQLY